MGPGREEAAEQERPGEDLRCRKTEKVRCHAKSDFCIGFDDIWSSLSMVSYGANPGIKVIQGIFIAWLSPTKAFVSVIVLPSLLYVNRARPKSIPFTPFRQDDLSAGRLQYDCCSRTSPTRLLQHHTLDLHSRFDIKLASWCLNSSLNGR